MPPDPQQQQGPWDDYAPPKPPVAGKPSGPWDDYAAPATTSPPALSLDKSTIGPQTAPANSPPVTDTMGAIKRYSGLEGAEDLGSKAFHSTDPIENYTQEGRTEHPILSRVGDVTRGLKTLFTGGQSAGEPLGTSSGLANNPVTGAMAAAPDAAAAGSTLEDAATNLPNIGSKIKGAGTRLFRGPSGAADVSVNPGTIISRELEGVIPKNEPVVPQGPQPMGAEKFEEVHGKKIMDAEEARQKELGNYGKLRTSEVPRATQEGTANRVPTKMPKSATPALTESGDRIGTVIDPSNDRGPLRVGNEGRGATWKTEDLYRIASDPGSDLASKREAVSQMVLRGLKPPDNYRYLMGDAAHGPATYNPRDVTKFDNEGKPIPIRQGGKKLTRVLE